MKFKSFLIAGIVSMLALLFSPTQALACPLCEDQLDQGWAVGFSLSVLFMLGMPFILIVGLGSQVLRALNPDGYAVIRRGIVSAAHSKWMLIPLSIGIALFLFSGISAGPPFKTIRLPRAQLSGQTDLNSGQLIESNQLDNRIVLVNVFATWCEPCQTEVIVLGDLYREYEMQGVTVVGVSLDLVGRPHRHPDRSVHYHVSPDGLQMLSAFLQTRHVPYPVISETPQLSASLQEVKAIPATFLFDRQGVLIKQYLGPLSLAALEADVQRLLRQANK